MPDATPLPPLAPLLEEGMLDVGDGHRLFHEVSGAPDGIPALYLHGGPGGRLTPGYRRNAPADAFRTVGFGQRGAGRSVPLASDPAHDLAANTTPHLIADIEALREHLGIDAWVLQGVSWGTHLAVAYAQAHPERVRGVVLMAVGLAERRHIDWITEGVGRLYPEAWDAFAAFAEARGGYDRTDASPDRLRIVEAYRRMLTSGDDELEAAAARAWMAWEDEHIRIGTGGLEIARPVEDPTLEQAAHALGFARLVTHYWAHDGFSGPGGLMAGMDRIGHIPAVLIHGRRDVSGPTVQAWELHRAWPASRLVVVEQEGHGGPIMASHWREAMQEFARALRP